jgi:hypothetical protein
MVVIGIRVGRADHDQAPADTGDMHRGAVQGGEGLEVRTSSGLPRVKRPPVR